MYQLLAWRPRRTACDRDGPRVHSRYCGRSIYLHASAPVGESCATLWLAAASAAWRAAPALATAPPAGASAARAFTASSGKSTTSPFPSATWRRLTWVASSTSRPRSRQLRSRLRPSRRRCRRGVPLALGTAQWRNPAQRLSGGVGGRLPPQERATAMSGQLKPSATKAATTASRSVGRENYAEERRPVYGRIGHSTRRAGGPESTRSDRSQLGEADVGTRSF